VRLVLKTFLLIGVLSTVATVAIPANAAEPQERGAYIGAGFGSSLFEDDGAFFGLDFDDSDQSIQVHAGYRFFRHFAVEGRYTDYGTFALQFVELDARAISAHAVGIIPFGASGWELFGQLGVGSLKVDFLGTDETQTTFAGGIGVRYFPTSTLSLGVQTDVHVWEDDSLGDTYIPGMGATQLVVQLNF
jgi:opacity protein-like surface antigen